MPRNLQTRKNINKKRVEMTKLEEKAKADLEGAKRYLERAKENLVIASELSSLLPHEILNIDWYIIRKNDTDKYYLETGILDNKIADKYIKILKLVGVQQITSRFKSYQNKWYYKGIMAVNGKEVEIMIDGGSKPPACRIEEQKEWKEVITYKAICKETEEEVK